MCYSVRGGFLPAAAGYADSQLDLYEEEDSAARLLRMREMKAACSLNTGMFIFVSSSVSLIKLRILLLHYSTFWGAIKRSATFDARTTTKQQLRSVYAGNFFCSQDDEGASINFRCGGGANMFR